MCKRDMFSRHHPVDAYSIAPIPYTAEQKLPTTNEMTVTKPSKHDNIGKEGTSGVFFMWKWPPRLNHSRRVRRS